MAHELQGFPQSSYYGKSRKIETNTTTVNDKFENEYNNFINDLKNKEETKIITETPVNESPIIPETVAPADAPILNETTTKKKKKKTEVVVETPVEE